MTFWVSVLFFLFYAGHSNDLFQRAKKLSGVGYAYAGPNCFSTALYFLKLKDVNIGVDVTEFESFLKLNCHKVDQPVIGSLGVIKPNADYSPIHSFVTLGEDGIFEKQGVGEFENIPLQINTFNNLKYRVIVPPYCRRHSPNDLSLCSNVVEYYACSKPEVTDALSAKIKKLQKTLFSWLEFKTEFDQFEFLNLLKEIAEIEVEVKSSDSHQKDFYLSQIVSVKKQMRYIELSEL